MGTPEFAVPTLKRLFDARHRIMLVVTQPDRPSGRGRKVSAPPVKQAALDLGLDTLQPDSMHAQRVHQHLQSLEPDLFVTIAFGKIVPAGLLKLPRLGAVNLHASLLPKYRGPAPIQWAILNGEAETGITAMFMDEGLDTGDILLADRIRIHPQDTSASLHDRLAELAATLADKTLQGLANRTIVPLPQCEDRATFAPRLTKKDGHIDWTLPAGRIERMVRAMNPWPGAFCFCDDRRLKIYSATPLDSPCDQPPGTIMAGYPGELLVATGSSALRIDEIQGASGRCLCARDFLCGCELMPGTVLK